MSGIDPVVTREELDRALEATSEVETDEYLGHEEEVKEFVFHAAKVFRDNSDADPTIEPWRADMLTLGAGLVIGLEIMRARAEDEAKHG